MIMDRLYGGVCYAGIDTDPELKYPKGAGRVAFSNQQSYIAAISARFVQLQHGDIDKRVSGDWEVTHLPSQVLIRAQRITLKDRHYVKISLKCKVLECALNFRCNIENIDVILRHVKNCISH